MLKGKKATKNLPHAGSHGLQGQGGKKEVFDDKKNRLKRPEKPERQNSANCAGISVPMYQPRGDLF